jgi:outer membrane lipoprotein SlyB
MTIRSFLLTGFAAVSISLTSCATSPGYSSSDYGSPGYGSPTASCYDCGTVTHIVQVTSGSSGVAGAVLGGIVGAAAGREIADDESEGRQNTATVAGGVAGAVAGSAIDRNVRGPQYDVHVRMDDGRTITVRQEDLGSIREGSYVRVYNGRVTLR